MNRPTIDQYRAICRLSTDDDFKIFMEWLRSSLEEVKTLTAVELDADSLRRWQGAYRALDHVIKQVHAAGEIINKAR